MNFRNLRTNVWARRMLEVEVHCMAGRATSAKRRIDDVPGTCDGTYGYIHAARYEIDQTNIAAAHACNRTVIELLLETYAREQEG